MVVTKTTPRTAEEVARTLREAASEHHAVTAVGGRLASGMGNPLARCDVELHTTALDRVLEHSQADMVVSAEAGITIEALQAHLAKAGQFLPIDPFNSPGHTIGGLLATAWTGPLRMRFGSARDFLIGIRVALPDGTLAAGGGRVVKNVSGYDMMKLHHGALGTLGIIVAASFKVFPKPLHDVTVESEDGWDGAARALATPVAPTALELFAGGHVLARYTGSPDAIERVVAGLGWKRAEGAVWDEHARRAPSRWARVAVPSGRLRETLDGLEGWWASPGVGIAHWQPPDAAAAQAVRRKAEAAGGSLVTLTPLDGVDAWGTPPATLEVMRRIKRAFDPDGVLNPGRFVV